MREALKNTALALGLSGAVALGAVTSLSAAPVPSATLAVSAAAPDHTTNVYWRGRWGWGGGLVAAGFVGAAATAAYGGYYPRPTRIRRRPMPTRTTQPTGVRARAVLLRAAVIRALLSEALLGRLLRSPLLGTHLVMATV